jgi:predicted metalloprotease with PDZ domain
MNPQLAEYFGVPNGEGVLVEEVEKDLAGAKAGLTAGDVIIRIGKRSVDNVDDITRELRNAEAGDKLELEVWRKGGRKTLTIEVTKNADRQRDRIGRRYFRVQPGDGAFEWNGEDDGEAAVRLRGELERLHELTPKVAPILPPRISRSVTI